MEDRASVYTIPLKAVPRKKYATVETNSTVNDSLPSINPPQHGQKVNSIRQDLNQTKTQITLMQAKLNNLRNLKQKYDGRNAQHLNQMQTISQIRERIRSQSELKQQFHLRKIKEQEMLHLQAEALRQNICKELQTAEQRLAERNMQQASEQRRKQKEHEYLIAKLKEIEVQENTRKATMVKQFHQTSQSRLREFHESRVVGSKQNYAHKFHKVKKEVGEADSQLRRLQMEEEALLLELKHSEKSMLSSLYNLNGFNPQKDSKAKTKSKINSRTYRFASSDRSIKFDSVEGEEDGGERIIL